MELTDFTCNSPEKIGCVVLYICDICNLDLKFIFQV